MARDTQSEIEKFAADVERAAGDRLVALVLYGSAARGDHHPTRSDLDLLVILSDAAPGVLQAIGPAMHRWAKAGHQPPLIFSTTGWRASADVFPMEIEDMRQSHRIIRGEDPFAGLETSPADLRRQLEREIRGKLLQLRSEYAASGADGKMLGELLQNSAKTFFVLFRALLRLKGIVPPKDSEAMVGKTAEVTGMEARGFEWVLRQFAGHRGPRLEPFDPVAQSYVGAVERLAEFVDGM